MSIYVKKTGDEYTWTDDGIDYTFSMTLGNNSLDVNDKIINELLQNLILKTKTKLYSQEQINRAVDGENGPITLLDITFTGEVIDFTALNGDVVEPTHQVAQEVQNYMNSEGYSLIGGPFQESVKENLLPASESKRSSGRRIFHLPSLNFSEKFAKVGAMFRGVRDWWANIKWPNLNCMGATSRRKTTNSANATIGINPPTPLGHEENSCYLATLMQLLMSKPSWAEWARNLDEEMLIQIKNQLNPSDNAEEESKSVDASLPLGTQIDNLTRAEGIAKEIATTLHNLREQLGIEHTDFDLCHLKQSFETALDQIYDTVVNSITLSEAEKLDLLGASVASDSDWREIQNLDNATQQILKQINQFEEQLQLPQTKLTEVHQIQAVLHDALDTIERTTNARLISKQIYTTYTRYAPNKNMIESIRKALTDGFNILSEGAQEDVTEPLAPLLFGMPEEMRPTVTERAPRGNGNSSQTGLINLPINYNEETEKHSINPQDQFIFQNLPQVISFRIIREQNLNAPIDILSAQEFVTASGERATYELKSFSLHTGSHQSGHYVAYVERGGQWYLCDDMANNKCKPIDREAALKIASQAFTIDYVKRSDTTAKIENLVNSSSLNQSSDVFSDEQLIEELEGISLRLIEDLKNLNIEDIELNVLIAEMQNPPECSKIETLNYYAGLIDRIFTQSASRNIMEPVRLILDTIKQRKSNNKDLQEVANKFSAIIEDALSKAAKKRHNEVAKAILDKLNRNNRIVQLSLPIAIENKNFELATLLLEKLDRSGPVIGNLVDAAIKSRRNPIEYAKLIELMKTALEKPFSKTAAKIALQTAVRADLIEFAENILIALLKEGFRQFDYTLEYAVLHERTEILKKILNLATDHIQVEDLANALRLSIRYKQTELTHLLFKHDRDYCNGEAEKRMLASTENKGVMERLGLDMPQILSNTVASV